MNAQTGPNREATDTNLAAILYRSRTTLTREAFESSGAPSDFARRNGQMGITGYLHYEDGIFYQLFEGPAAEVARLWSSIQRDSRHHDVATIRVGRIARRRFGHWTMGYNKSDPRSLFDWTARSGLSLRGPKYPQIVTAFLEYASAGTRATG